VGRTQHDPAGHAEHPADLVSGQRRPYVEVGKIGLRDHDPVLAVALTRVRMGTPQACSRSRTARAGIPISPPTCVADNRNCTYG
jgi:hypothetical protein